MFRTANIILSGSAKEAMGMLSIESGALKDVLFSYHTRFEEGIGTNAEELMAAALGLCFAMKLSFVLAEKGFKTEKIEAVARIEFDKEAIKSAHIDVKAKVPGISEKIFEECANEAKLNSIVAKTLNLPITGDGLLLQNAPA